MKKSPSKFSSKGLLFHQVGVTGLQLNFFWRESGIGNRVFADCWAQDAQAQRNQLELAVHFPPMCPTIIGSFQILRELGRGLGEKNHEVRRI